MLTPPADPRQLKFSRFAWGMLAYMLLAIVWGVFVRASGSGDGCGQHWPACGGVLDAHGAVQFKTWVERGHRYTTELLGVFVFAEFIWAFLVFPARHPVRYAATST